MAMARRGGGDVRVSVKRLCENLENDARGSGPVLMLRHEQALSKNEMRALLQALFKNTTVQVVSFGRQDSLTKDPDLVDLLLAALRNGHVWCLEMGEMHWDEGCLDKLLNGLQPHETSRPTKVAFGFIDWNVGNNKKQIARFKAITKAQRRDDKAARTKALEDYRWGEVNNGWLDPANFWWIAHAFIMTRCAWYPRRDAGYFRSSGYFIPVGKKPKAHNNPRNYVNKDKDLYSEELPNPTMEARKINKTYGNGAEYRFAAEVLTMLADDLPYAAFPSVEMAWWDAWGKVMQDHIDCYEQPQLTAPELALDLLFLATAQVVSADEPMPGVAPNPDGNRVLWPNDSVKFEKWRADVLAIATDETASVDPEAYKQVSRLGLAMWTSDIHKNVRKMFKPRAEDPERAIASASSDIESDSFETNSESEEDGAEEDDAEVAQAAGSRPRSRAEARPRSRGPERLDTQTPSCAEAEVSGGEMPEVPAIQAREPEAERQDTPATPETPEPLASGFEPVDVGDAPGSPDAVVAEQPAPETDGDALREHSAGNVADEGGVGALAHDGGQVTILVNSGELQPALFAGKVRRVCSVARVNVFALHIRRMRHVPPFSWPA